MNEINNSLTLYLITISHLQQIRCEAILRSQPQLRMAKELHLASLDAQEEKEIRKMKQTAAASVGVAAAIGVVAGVASLLMKKH